MIIIKKYNIPKYNENKWPIELAAISQKVATQQPKQNFKYNEYTLGESSLYLWHQNKYLL